MQSNFDEAHNNLKEALEIQVQNARTQRKFSKAPSSQSFAADDLNDDLLESENFEDAFAPQQTDFSVN